MTRVTLYSKPECCLCDEARAVIEAVASDRPLVLEEIDITGDADLMEHYGESVPVVLIDGRPAYEYHVDERDLRQRLAAAGATA
jgi:glutaredoxin